MKTKNLFVLFALSMLVAAPALAEVSVIVNPANTAEMSQDEIGRIFLGKMRTYASGEPVSPVSLAEGHPVQAEFTSSVLGRSDSQLKAYWSKLIFTGKGNPPPEVASVEEMLQKVASEPGAIGYVPSDAVTGQVREIGKF